MKRWFIRLVLAALLIITAVSVVVWLGLRASLPVLDGNIAASGLQSAVTIERDAQGIATIIASSRLDLAYATGFAHGQDRFFQMDLIRRQAAGELSEIIGVATIEVDKRYRFHRFRDRARATLASSPAAEAEIVRRYAAGVNAGRDSLGAKPFEYFLLSVDPEEWLPEDSLLVVYAMYVDLNDSTARRDVRRGLMHRVLPEEVYDWMYPPGSPWDVPLMGRSAPLLPIPSADVFDIRGSGGEAPSADERGKPPLNGSNNFAVSGDLTANGRAMVSNDMHLGLSVPNIYYQARLVVTGQESRSLMGVTLPGTPLVIAGSNTKVAWGYTNSYGDWTDAVVLRPGLSPDTYKTPDGDMPFEEYVESIAVKDSDAIELLVRETVWGPVVEDANYPDGDIAVSWIAHKPNGVNLRLLDIETADSLVAALDIANTIAMPPQNFVAGDAHGNIGWTIAGSIPLRSAYDAMLPADWSVNEGWIGWLAAEDYPRVVNPDSDRIWTANSRVVDFETLAIVGDGGYDLGARAKQIRDGLFAKEQFEPADMLAIQYDDRALFLVHWRFKLLEVLDEETIAADPELQEYRRLVETWVPRATPESVGYRLVRAFRLELRSRLFFALTGSAREAYGDDVRLRISNQFEAPLWSLLTEQPPHMLPSGYDNWHEFMLAAIRENIRYFSENFSGPLAQRSWGERNTANIQHPLSRAVPALSRFLDMPQDLLNGDSNMPKAQGPGFGASERFSVSPGDEANGLMHMPTGQSGHPLSPFYRAGHDDWVAGRPAPFLPGPTQHTLVLLPAD